MCAGFLAANPYALLDHQAFRDGLEKQTETAGEDGGKLGLANTSGWRYYLRPSPGAWAGCRRCSRSAAPSGCSRATAGSPAARARAGAAVPLPRQPVALLRALDAADLPDPLPARGLGRDRRRDWLAPLQLARRDPRARALGAGAPAGPRLQRSTTTSCWPGRHALVARDWMVAEHPVGQQDRRRADRARPVGDGPRVPVFEAQGGTGSGNRWNKWRTSRSCFFNGKQITGRLPRGQDRGLRAHHAPELVGAYERGGFCWVVTGSTQFGRAYADPSRCRTRSATTTSSSANGESFSAPARTARTPSGAVLVRLLVQLLPAHL